MALTMAPTPAPDPCPRPRPLPPTPTPEPGPDPDPCPPRALPSSHQYKPSVPVPAHRPAVQKVAKASNRATFGLLRRFVESSLRAHRVAKSGHSLQPYVAQPATVRGAGCNRARYSTEAAAVRDAGCRLQPYVWPRLQPHVHVHVQG